MTYEYHPKDVTFPLNYSMTNEVRMKHLHKSVYDVKDIDGDLVEIGVCRGGSSMCMALSSLRNGIIKPIRLYDTFEGMTMPTVEDRRSKANKGPLDTLNKWMKNRKETHNEWCYGSLTEVKINMDRTRYPKDKLFYYKGDITKNTEFIPEKISLLRIDVDFYEPTLACLKKFYTSLQHGGILIMDDYNAWDGAKKAWHDYCELNNIVHTVEVIDQSAVFKIKEGK